MNITSFLHADVSESGVVKNGGEVAVNGRFTTSERGGGCGLRHCHCSGGHWIFKVFPRTAEGNVFGYKVSFSSQQELDDADVNAIEDAILRDPRISIDVVQAIAQERKLRRVCS